MHRVVQDQIERMIAQKGHASDHSAAAHLAGCSECRLELEAMHKQAGMLRQLRPPKDFEAEPRAGFYARVMERIEAEGPVSIWNLFMESPFGRRIAVASLALAVVLGVYLVSSEKAADDPIIAQSTLSPTAVDLQEQAGITHGQLALQMDLGQSGGQAVLVDPFAPGYDADLVSGRLPIQGASLEQGDDGVLSNLMTYREQ